MLSNSSFRQEFNVCQVFKVYGLSFVQEVYMEHIID